MPTFIGQTREVVILNNGSTTDRQPTINVQLSAPMGPNTMLVLYINGTPSMTASVEISPTEYTFSPRCNPGIYAFRVDVIQTDGVSTVIGTSPSNVNNVVVEAINQAWSSTINQDGPYAVGNSGSSDPFADFNWEDSFWIAALGNLKGTDLVEWQTTWTPGSDGWNPPNTIVHPADANNPWRLEVQAHSGNWNGYSSGVLEVELLINGIVQGDKLQLVLNDEPYGYEGATWAVWVAPIPNPFYIRWNYAFNTSNLVTDDALPVEYGAPTPGVPYYILDNGQTVSSAARLMFVADPGSMLQTGDIIVLQGVLHQGTLTGQETSQCLDVAQGIYVPMTRSLDEYFSGAYDNNLQPSGSGGVNWQQLKSDCGYPLENAGHAFTVAITPVINTDGFVNSFWAPFFEFTSADLAGFAHGTVLTSKINGVAVYRGGSIAPGNLIYSAVRQDLFTLQTEIRKPIPARLGWGTFAFDGTSGSGANLEFVNGRVDALGYNVDTTQSAQVSSGPNVYGRLAAPTTCAFGLVEDDGATYTIRVEYGPPGYDTNGVQFPTSTLNAMTCPVTWDGHNGVMTLPTMDKPCTGVLGEDNDVRIYLVRNGVDVGYLLMNVVDVPNSIWEFQVPVWFAYTSL